MDCNNFTSQDVRYSTGDIRSEMQKAQRQSQCTGWFARKDNRREEWDAPTELDIFGAEKKSGGGIDFDQYDKIPVEVSGRDAEDYKPMEFFSDMELAESLSWNLKRCGYERPTPVQKYAVPMVVGGRDVMACAQTGSGKTCAFMVPCLESLLRSGPPSATSSSRRPTPAPCALVLAPTRELAVQIHEESMKFAYNTGIRCRIVYGGANIQEQARELYKGTDILVATPGRLSDMIGRKFVDLGVCQFLILDEADRMLDMGFEPQVRDIVMHSGLGEKTEIPRQSMMFSATFAGGVQLMAGDFLTDYIFITVGRVGSCSETITQHLFYAEEGRSKTRALEKVMREHMPPAGLLTVIFVETKKSADTLETDLWGAGFKVCAIHGDRTQIEREDALAAFKTGENPILVATDVAARGLDISNVGLVINYDMPKQMDDYVHRIGRTGRAGKRGTAIALVNEKCRYIGELAKLMREAKQEVPSWVGQLARDAQAAYSYGKAYGKGATNGASVNGTVKGAVTKDIRMQNVAAPQKEVKKEEVVEVAPPPKRERTPSPPREIPDSWDDSDAEF